MNMKKRKKWVWYYPAGDQYWLPNNGVRLEQLLPSGIGIKQISKARHEELCQLQLTAQQKH